MNPDLLAALTRELRSLPLRRAPRSLEQRVRARLAAQAALPWWRRSWASWPLAMRLVSVSVCLAGILVGSVRFKAMWRGIDFTGLLAERLPWLATARHLAGIAVSVGASILHAVPEAWLCGIAADGFLSAAMLAAGATAALHRFHVNNESYPPFLCETA